MASSVSGNIRPTVWVNTLQETDPRRGLPPGYVALIKQHFDIVTAADVDGNHELGKKVEGAAIYVSYGEFMRQFEAGLLPGVKVVANHGVGVNHIDVEGLAKKAVRVANTPGVLSDCTADMAFALLLASARNVKQGVDFVMGRKPGAEMDINYHGVRVWGSTLGIVGMGDIGYKVARRGARGFDMRVLYHNRTQRSTEDEAAVSATYCSNILDMLPQCDYIVITCPLTSETEMLFSKAAFTAMKETGTVINISRGHVVDQDALYDALTTNQIRAAALDVTYPEPLPRDHPLLGLDNCLVVPHFGSATKQTRRAMLETVVLNLKVALIEGKPMPNEVKPKN